MRSCRADDLSPAPLSVFRTLDDTRQVKELNFCAVESDDSGYARQGCEFVRRHLAERAREFVEEGGLSHAGEADESNATVTRLADVESLALAPPCSWRRLEQLTLQLRQLRLEHTQVPFRRLVFLRSRHLLLDLLDLYDGRRHGGMKSGRV